jgi:hypothetical protein
VDSLDETLSERDEDPVNEVDPLAAEPMPLPPGFEDWCQEDDQMIISIPDSFKSSPLSSPSKSKREIQDDVAQEIQKLRESLGGNNEQARQDSQVVGGYQMVSPQQNLNDQEPVAITLAAMEMLAT